LAAQARLAPSVRILAEQRVEPNFEPVAPGLKPELAEAQLAMPLAVPQEACLQPVPPDVKWAQAE
jgi:hypothetical protein